MAPPAPNPCSYGRHQISGLLSNQAFDWKSVVDQLIAADSIPLTNLQKDKDANTTKITALADINTALQALQDQVQSIRTGDVFKGRVVSSDNPNTTWKSSTAAGAPVGTYKFAVTQLAAAASIRGGSDIAGGLSDSDVVTGVTLASMNTAVAVKAGYFTVAGQRVTIATTDSLQDVFDKISAATDGAVTGRYDSAADKVVLSSSSGDLIVGAVNDTSNFLAAMKLGNSGGLEARSASALGILPTTATLATAGLRTDITAVDPQGKGSFSINNVPIDYNIQTDSLAAVLDRINQSTAGVTATYDATNDRVILTNKTTGDSGITLSESAGGLLGALKLTGAALTRGKDAVFTVNDGAPISSATNTLDASSHGITGLSVTITSETTETLTVDSDTNAMQAALTGFLDKFNALQDLIEQDTKITVEPGKIEKAVLYGNGEVESWGRQLRQMAFDVVSGVTGTVQRLDNLGIDFDGITGHLVIKDQAKLSNVLMEHPGDVQAFFVSGTSGMVPQLYGLLSALKSGDSKQQGYVNDDSASIDDQITALQARLDQERETLTNSFLRMLDAQSVAQTQNQALTNAFFKKSDN